MGWPAQLHQLEGRGDIEEIAQHKIADEGDGCRKPAVEHRHEGHFAQLGRARPTEGRPKRRQDRQVHGADAEAGPQKAVQPLPAPNDQDPRQRAQQRVGHERRAAHAQISLHHGKPEHEDDGHPQVAEDGDQDAQGGERVQIGQQRVADDHELGREQPDDRHHQQHRQLVIIAEHLGLQDIDRSDGNGDHHGGKEERAQQGPRVPFMLELGQLLKRFGLFLGRYIAGPDDHLALAPG